MLRALLPSLLSCAVLSTTGSAFVAPGQSSTRFGPGTAGDALGMGLLDGLFGGSKTADASHILVKGPGASQRCEKLKADIYKKAIGRGDPSMGVEAEKLMSAVSKLGIS